MPRLESSHGWLLSVDEEFSSLLEMRENDDRSTTVILICSIVAACHAINTEIKLVSCRNVV
jgi:hypothetical protein